MNRGIILIGAIILTVSIFGYTFSENQQGILEQSENILTGEQQDWSLIQSLSAAGIVGGILIILIGLLPETWYPESRGT